MSEAVDPHLLPACVAIVGPTATGKSDVAVHLAGLIGGEVVNADAFQVYRGMDIGTAKVSRAQRAAVAHHLVDILDVAQDISVASFQGLGRVVLGDLALRGVPAVVVGGSGLYVRALLDDLRFPGSDPEIRAHWERQLACLGPQGLHTLLRERDPDAAAHILPTNGRRIVRALEVGQLTGTGFVAQLPVDGPPFVAHVSVGLDLPRDQLDERIRRRVDLMFEQGLVDEVRQLIGRGLRDGRTASRATGYPQVLELLDGRIDLATAVEGVVLATQRLARRQQRWFHRDPRTTWLDAGAEPSSTASRIVGLLAASPRKVGP